MYVLLFIVSLTVHFFQVYIAMKIRGKQPTQPIKLPNYYKATSDIKKMNVTLKFSLADWYINITNYGYIGEYIGEYITVNLEIFMH